MNGLRGASFPIALLLGLTMGGCSQRGETPAPPHTEERPPSAKLTAFAVKLEAYQTKLKSYLKCEEEMPAASCAEAAKELNSFDLGLGL